MYEFWYDYVKSKYDKNAKICCMETDKDVETRFDTFGFNKILN